MESPLIIYPNTKEETNLYKQLAKRLKNRIEEKGIAKNTKKKRKEQILDDFSESIREMKLHMEGKIELPTIEEILNEL